MQRHVDSAFYKVELLQLHFLSTIYRASSELRIILKRSLQTTMPEIDGERIFNWSRTAAWAVPTALPRP